jgi:hypothetical protein
MVALLAVVGVVLLVGAAVFAGGSPEQSPGPSGAASATPAATN